MWIFRWHQPPLLSQGCYHYKFREQITNEMFISIPRARFMCTFIVLSQLKSIFNTLCRSALNCHYKSHCCEMLWTEGAVLGMCQSFHWHQTAAFAFYEEIICKHFLQVSLEASDVNFSFSRCRKQQFSTKCFVGDW